MKHLCLTAAILLSTTACKKVQYSDEQPPPGDSLQAQGADSAAQELSLGEQNDAPEELSAFAQEWVERAQSGDGVRILSVGEGEAYELSYSYDAIELQRVVVVSTDGIKRETREMVVAPTSEGPYLFLLHSSQPQENPGDQPVHDFDRSLFAFSVLYDPFPNGRVARAELENGETLFSGNSPDEIAAWLQQMTVIFPIGEVGVGAQWATEIPHPLKPEELAEISYALENLSDSDAEISFRIAPVMIDGEEVHVNGYRLVSPMQPLSAGDIIVTRAGRETGTRIMWTLEDDE